MFYDLCNFRTSLHFPPFPLNKQPPNSKKNILYPFYDKFYTVHDKFATKKRRCAIIITDPKPNGGNDMKKLTAILAAIIMSLSATSCAIYDENDTLPNDFPFMHIFDDSEAAPEQTTTENESEATVTTAYVTTAAPETTAVTATTTAKTTVKTMTTTTAPIETIDVEPVQNKLKYHEYITRDFSDNLIRLEKSRGIFNVYNSRTWYFFNFGDHASSGIGKNGYNVLIDGYGVVSGTITNNRILNVTASVRDNSITCESLNISFEDRSEVLNYKISENNSSITCSADLYDASFKNGFYEIKASFTFEGKTKTACIYLLVNCKSDKETDYDFYLCNGEQHDHSEEFQSFVDRKEQLLSLLKKEGVTPQTALKESYHYPSAANENNDDSAYWVTLSHKIIKGYENASASTKALLLHDWITSNLKYDFYKVNVLIDSRYISNGMIDPSQYVSKNYTGVCLDFSCIYAIMCRECGIPCVVLNNNNHAWNAVYIDGRWYEIDLTIDTNRCVYGADTNDVSNEDMLYWYSGFCTPIVNSETPDTAIRFCW